MQSVSSPLFGAHHRSHASAVSASQKVRFGETFAKTGEDAIKLEAKATPQTKSLMRRMAFPAAWMAAGALLFLGTAGMLHFIGIPLLLYGAYKAVKNWKA